MERTVRGFLPVNKPPGITSYQVIREIKRYFRGRIGHGGTLDPFAGGLLIVLLNEATKLAPFILDSEKEYTGTIRLGVKTDTFDITGQTTEQREVPVFSVDGLQSAAGKFVGSIEQRPPSFAALKHEGKKFYELAREGKDVPVRLRQGVIRELEITGYAAPEVGFRAVVGRGTYLRSLANDFGETLGCGGCLAALLRRRIGRASLDQAVGIPGSLDDMMTKVRPAEELVVHLPRIVTDQVLDLVQGKGVVNQDGLADGQFVRIVDAAGRFLAIGIAGGKVIKPKRIIFADAVE